MRHSSIARCCFALACAAGSPLVALPFEGAWKVDPQVLGTVKAGGETEVLVILAEQADLGPAAGIRGKEAKGRYVVEQLIAVASANQPPLLAALEARGVPYRSYWIVNMVWVRANGELVRELAGRADVARLAANPQAGIELPPGLAGPRRMTAGPEPNLAFLRVPEVYWAAGFTGQGAVVGMADSGQDWDHPALRGRYRGWDGVDARHDYNWHDAIHVGGGSCGADSLEPCDDNDHGTPTAGLTVGDDGLGNQIGMAPGARWIGCRNMDQGVGTPATYAECFQFFLAPTNLAGENPRPELAPDVVNNSWRCPPFEGCTDPDVLQAPVGALRAAGIVVVASAGNDGNHCGALDAPPAIYDASWTVGSCNLFGEVSSFSSRGPVESDGSRRVKPDFLAPGEDIRSSANGGGYLHYSGTSMSGPHVAGMVALMLSARPCLVGEVDTLENQLRANAFAFDTSEACGGVPGDVVPNNTYGWGIVQSALPSPRLCTPRAGGEAWGVLGQRARCRNRDSGQTVTVPLAGTLVWDCVAAGLEYAPGERVAELVRGEATGGAVGGRAYGLDARRAACRNLRTGVTVRPKLEADGSWDCTAAGLEIEPGDTVVQVFRGPAD